MKPHSQTWQIPRKILVLVCGILAVLLISSACTRRQRPLLLITDIPEVLQYTEFLRGEDAMPLLEVRFVEEPDRQIALGGVNPDIVISTRIGHEDFIPYLHSVRRSSLEFIPAAIRDDFILDDLYPAALAPFHNDRGYRVLPLAYDIPLLYVTGNVETRFSERDSVSIDELLSLSSELNTIREDSYVQMGFSALRNLLFVELLLADSSGQRGYFPDRDALTSALDSINTRFNEVNQDALLQNNFNSLIAFSPDHSDMSQERLFSALGTLTQRVTEENSLINQFPFLWLEDSTGVPVLNPGIYAGILSESRRKRESLRVLRILLSSRAQNIYLQNSDRGDFSLFFNRLSSNRVTNDYLVPQFNPGFELPREDSLVFPDAPPALWSRLRLEVIQPWLEAYFSNESKTVEELLREIGTFYQLNGGYN